MSKIGPQAHIKWLDDARPMGRSGFFSVVNAQSIYCITFTCYQWPSLIERSESYGAAHKFFKVPGQKGQSDRLFYHAQPAHLLLHYTGKEKI
jgi:hypothetical protein